MGKIRINQMGYTSDRRKQLIYIGNEMTFKVMDALNHHVVMLGKLTEQRFDEASQDYVKTGDFSEVIDPGSYYIQIGEERSYTFDISPRQPVICTDALLKGIYYQRCGVELKKEHADPWQHASCHLQPSYVFRQDAELLLKLKPKEIEQIDTLGGWHDAGDYGRYTVGTIKTVADIMLAYEHYESVFDHPIDILESSLEGPDVLYEVKVGLDFLLKMQKISDGSVYTKVASRHFPGMIMPEKDTKPLFIFDTSSPATAGFAAVMAMAARIYGKMNLEYAERCQRAAEKAYQWLKLNPEPKLFKNPSDITSGEYGDKSDLDERYWAAAQLYRTTGDDSYHKDFIAFYGKLKGRTSLGWQNVSGYATIAYLFSERDINPNLYEELRHEWLDFADTLEQRSRQDGYGITLTRKEYCWGSTMVLLNQSMHLIIANRLLGKPLYDEIIQNSWDYILGRNPMDISYVTGLGSNAIRAPHHRPSAADGVDEPVPGLLSGGPNINLQDEVVRKLCKGNPPAKCFADHTESFSTNEIDTYWNSVAIYVGAYQCSKYCLKA